MKNINVLGHIYNNIKKATELDVGMGKGVGVLISLQGSARCFAAGTRVRMADGTLKNVEDIVVGDKVMSADGKGCNTVVGTHNGIDMMYRVHQPRGIDYIVNSQHILSLKQTQAFTHKVRTSKLDEPYTYKLEPIEYDKEVVHDISVIDWLKTSSRYKSKYAGTKNTLLQLPKKDVIIDPYYLGIWLGDGTACRWHEISNSDKEVIDYFYNYAKSLSTEAERISGVTYRIKICGEKRRSDKINELVAEQFNEFKRLNLINNKHVPKLYLYNSYDNRLKLLAGLIDSDGYLTKRGKLSITQKNKQIAESIVELCRICGFYTNGLTTKVAKMKRNDGSVYKCIVYIVEINHNDFNDLNKYMRVERKKVLNKQCDRNYFTTKITIKQEGIGEYYGFTLDNNPYFLLEDGTLCHNSGKTYNTMIWLIMEALKEKCKISVVRQSLPSLKRSAYEDFKRIMFDMGIYSERRMNKSDMVYYFENGSVFEFLSGEEGQKLRGPNRDILFCNEANELEEEIFSQLRMRTNRYTIIDYNPSFDEDHWIFRLNKDNRTFHFVSTYKENLFLSKAIVAEIESYKVTNPTMWQIYGLGQRAIIEGLVFPQENWDIIPDDAFPTWIHEGYVGLDWGFVSDPSVGEHVILSGNDIYVNEIFRSLDMKTQDIADALRDYDDLQKYCDIDNRLVTELEEANINLLSMTIKNSESIKVGIALMNQRKIHITESSTDLIKEMRNYVYKKDRYDNYQTNLKPVDKFNHGIDAVRYVVLAESHVLGYNSVNKQRSKQDLGLFM